MTITRRGITKIKYAMSPATDGKFCENGTIEFWAELDGRKTTLEVPFKNALTEKDAHAGALKVLHQVASEFGKMEIADLRDGTFFDDGTIATFAISGHTLTFPLKDAPIEGDAREQAFEALHQFMSVFGQMQLSDMNKRAR